MPTSRLQMHAVAKPWGRHRLWPGFADPAADAEPIGEIWFRPLGDDPPLLIKYLFTSERLSIQVHPDDDHACAAGHHRGKDEAWVILDAAAGATIALGLTAATTREHLRAAALDGSIERLVDWKPVAAGDVVYSPAGTVHAIGGGLTLIEVQQNVDLTYRLYDYGRPRELHLDAGLAVAEAAPYAGAPSPVALGDGRTILVAGPKFVLERWRGGTRVADAGSDAVFVAVAGGGTIDGDRFAAGECWSVAGSAAIVLDNDADALFAYPGDTVMPG